MGRRNLPARTSIKTAELPGLGKIWPVWAVLVPCVWMAFSPVLNNGFVDLDDRDWILDNHSFRGLGWDQFQFAFSTLKGGVYQPLGWLLQSFSFELFGLDPRGYHLVSLLFHLVNTVLLHLLCVALMTRTMPEVAKRLGSAVGWLCGVPVALYALHPLRVELVAWASAQAYLPSIMLSLLATLAYLRANPASGICRRPWMIGSSLLIALAVLTKGSAVVMPFVFLILDAYPLRRLGGGRPSWPVVRMALIEKGPILIYCLGFTAVAFIAKKWWGVDPEVTAEPNLVGRSAQACFGACFYLVKTVWPFGITVFYPRPEGDNFLTPIFGACAAGVVIAASGAIWQRRRSPALVAALAVYLVILSPYLGLAQVSAALASDRYCHSALIAWVVLGCAGICKLFERRWSRPVLIGAGAGVFAVTLGLLGACAAQCRVWESSEHLWGHALEHAKWSSQLHDYMGSTLAEERKLEPAIAEFREALRIRPDDFEATCGLGVAFDRRGETKAAVAYLREAVRLRPKNARAQLNLGEALVHQGHINEAVALYCEALQLHPNFPSLHFALGVAFLHQRKFDQSITELTKAVELRPWNIDAHNILGGALVLRGRLDDAAAQYREALRLDPAHSASRVDLGLTLARQGHSGEAITQLREAIWRDRQNPEAHQILAAVLANSGRIAEAAREYEAVLRVRPEDAKARAFLTIARSQGKPGISTKSGKIIR